VRSPSEQILSFPVASDQLRWCRRQSHFSRIGLRNQESERGLIGFEGKGVRSLFHEAIRAIADELDFRVRKCDSDRV
jgi:hypothetical protein